MRILVAGGAGYIGSRLVPELIDMGYTVDVVDLLWFGNYLPKDVNVIQKDLFKMDETDLTSYDQVIFVAGLSNDPMAELWPSENFIQNGACASYLAFISKRAGVKRFIYASSCSVYGYTVNELFDEERPTTCNYPYGISKLQGERGCLQIQDENFSVIAIRKGTVSGYSPRMRLDLIVNTMFKAAMMNKKLIVNNPAIWRPILDIRDAVSGYIRAVQADQSVSGVFNISSGNYTVGQVGEIVQKKLEDLSGEKIKIEIKDVKDFRNYKILNDKAKVCLGFDPKYKVEDIVEELYIHKDEFKDYNYPNYSNVEVLKRIKKESDK